MKNQLSEMISIVENFHFTKDLLNDWNSFEIDHTKQSINNFEKSALRRTMKDIKGKIGGEDPNISGLYIYYDKEEDEYLYLGKTKKLANRIYEHYKESQDIWGSEDWRIFFGKYPKKLTVLFKPIDSSDKQKGEALRIIIERLLTFSMKPKFEEFHKTIK